MKRNGFENLTANGCDRVCVDSERNGHQFDERTKAPAKDVANGTLKIDQSIAYMREHLDKPLQVSILAQRANVSSSYYFTLFKRQTGTAPIDYFIRLKMRHARELLDATPASVKEIAATLGYHDPFYFSRVFKLVNRVAPTEYRARRARSSATKTDPTAATAEFSRSDRMLKISLNGTLAAVAG